MHLPVRMINPVLAGLLAMVLSTHAHATRQDDSLRTVVEGASDPIERTRALLRMAGDHERIRPGECLKHAESALISARASGDDTLIHEALVRIRDLQSRHGALDELLRISIEAADVSERMGAAAMMAEDEQWISVVYERAGDLEGAEEAARKALILSTAAKDNEAVTRHMLHLVRVLVKANKLKEVIVHSEKALQLFTQRGDTIGQACIWTLKAEALLASHRPGDALPLLVRAATVLQERGPAIERLRVWSALAAVHDALGDAERARTYVDRAVVLSEAIGERERTVDLLALSSGIHERKGETLLALRDERRSRMLDDSLMDRRMADRVAGMKELYRTGRMGRELVDLRARNNANEDMIARAQVRGRWWLAGFVLLVVLLGTATWILLARRRTIRRIRMKNTLIRQQAERIHATNMELDLKNRRLLEALSGEEEKSMLLKEVHHRVKNNLQTVNALLRMQCDLATDNSTNEIMRDAQGRVRTMALVHENLYRRGDLARVDMRSHLTELCNNVLDPSAALGRVTVDLACRRDMLPMEAVLPLSLLVNELLSNSIKHAFPGSTTGRVRIILDRKETDECELYYHDDGIGLPSGTAFKGGFGMSLIRAFVEQLEGQLRVIPGDGTTIVIAFPLRERMRRAG